MPKQDLNTAIEAWKNKVLATYDNNNPGCVDTFAMIRDIDAIIAKAFDHDPVLP